MDLDNYLTPVISDTICELFEPEKADRPEEIIFSFGMVPEYRSTRLKLKKISPDTKLATITKLRRVHND